MGMWVDYLDSHVTGKWYYFIIMVTGIQFCLLLIRLYNMAHLYRCAACPVGTLMRNNAGRNIYIENEIMKSLVAFPNLKGEIQSRFKLNQ